MPSSYYVWINQVFLMEFYLNGTQAQPSVINVHQRSNWGVEMHKTIKNSGLERLRFSEQVLQSKFLKKST